MAALALIVVCSNTCGSKPHPSQVHMRMYQGVELLCGNIHTLHQRLRWHLGSVWTQFKTQNNMKLVI